MRFLWYGWIAAVVLVGTVGAHESVRATAREPAPTPEASPAPPDLPRFIIRSVGDYENLWFDVTINAGASMELTAAIRNVGDVDTTLRTYATNANNPANGGFSAGTEGDEPTGAALWLDYPRETVQIQPGEKHEVDFAVTVPAGTPPGNYVAALVAQSDKPLGIPGSAMFAQIIRNTISVEITVPGEMTTAFELGNPVVSPVADQWTLDIPVTNTGTARVRPQGELLVTTPDGEPVSSTHVKMGSVYGGNSTSIRVGLPEQLPIGDYLVSLVLEDEGTGAGASIYAAPVTVAAPATPEPVPTFAINQVSVTQSGDPVQYADVTATITNNGQAIPTANTTLIVKRDGEDVESYPLVENVALPAGSATVDQRYIPVDGWQPGTYSFELVISAVSGDTETILATIDVEDEIVAP